MTPADADLKAFRDRLLLRSELAPEEQMAIMSLPGRVVSFEAHREIVRLGERAREACLVLDGVAARIDEMSLGERQITALHIRGDMCDLHSTVLPVASWCIEAATPVRVLKVPHEAILELAAKYPSIATAFWRDTTADAAMFAKWIANVGRKEARPRLAHLLCEMAIRTEYAGLGQRTCYPFGLTQIQIADALGLTPVHVNRTLQALRALGFVDLRAGQVMIRDWGELVALAEFDPLYLHISPKAIGSTG